MRTWNLLAGSLLFVCVSQTCRAFEVGVGASINQKNLIVKNVNQTEISSLEGNAQLWPYLSIKTEDKYFGESSFGYFYYGWYSQAAVDRVKDHPDQVLPSPVRMDFLYAGATAFYIFGNKRVTKENFHTQHAIGIGLGWGASRIEGAIPAAYTKTGVDENISSNLTGSSYNLFYRYLWEEMFFMFDVSGVQVNNGSRRYESGEFSIIFGRYFEL